MRGRAWIGQVFNTKARRTDTMQIAPASHLAASGGLPAIAGSGVRARRGAAAPLPAVRNEASVVPSDSGIEGEWLRHDPAARRRLGAGMAGSSWSRYAIAVYNSHAYSSLHAGRPLLDAYA